MAETKPVRLAKAHMVRRRATVFSPTGHTSQGIYAELVDKLSYDKHEDFESVIKNCRFFFRHDPLAATVINKVVDFAINDIVVDTGGRAKTTEVEIYDALSTDLKPFLRKAAYEYLLTGLVVPEIRLTRIRKAELRGKGIKRLESLLYPTSMWVRDSATINIKKPRISEKESYFVVIDDDLYFFIKSKGQYPDGTEDPELYTEILRLYPDFITEVLANPNREVLLENPLIVKGTTTEDSPYPIPYLYPALEALKHKRNLRRMDYSIAARVIGAILHVKVGSDEYPLTEDQEDIMTDLEQKFQWRSGITPAELERVFALFTNHTVELEWILPDVTAMLDSDKYKSINEDIMVALGFPRILITGETERSFASDPQIATISPLHTMEKIRDSLLPIVKHIFREMQDHNRIIEEYPIIKFKPLNLMSMSIFFEGLAALYEAGNLSRESHMEAFGYDFTTEQNKRKTNEEYMKELGVEPVAPSNKPGAVGPDGKPVTKPGAPTKPPEGKK